MRSEAHTIRSSAGRPRLGRAGPVRDVPEWRIFAACGGVASLFYKTDMDSEEQTRHRVTKAKAVCEKCPVRPQCAAHALTVPEQYGIWAGFTESERTLLLATRHGDRDRIRDPGESDGGAARPRLVPGDDRELVGQGGELRLPDAAVLGGAVHEHQRRPLADALVRNLEPLRQDDLQHPNVYALRGPVGLLRTEEQLRPHHVRGLRNVRLRQSLWSATPVVRQGSTTTIEASRPKAGAGSQTTRSG
jgi:WhiB family redox-sensing transcriptional regulator